MSAYSERFSINPNNNIWILQKMLMDEKAERIKKVLALISLARMASEESIGVLERYYESAGAGMKVYVKLALDEAICLID